MFSNIYEILKNEVKPLNDFLLLNNCEVRMFNSYYLFQRSDIKEEVMRSSGRATKRDMKPTVLHMLQNVCYIEMYALFINCLKK